MPGLFFWQMSKELSDQYWIQKKYSTQHYLILLNGLRLLLSTSFIAWIIITKIPHSNVTLKSMLLYKNGSLILILCIIGVCKIQLSVVLSWGWCAKTCSCPFVRYFRTLLWDDITLIWDENIVYFFDWEKKTVLD